MTDEGYRNRLYAIEWHVELWRVNGTPVDLCAEVLHHLQEVLDADFYGEDRPTTGNKWAKTLEAYLDRLFAAGGALVSWE